MTNPPPPPGNYPPPPSEGGGYPPPPPPAGGFSPPPAPPGVYAPPPPPLGGAYQPAPAGQGSYPPAPAGAFGAGPEQYTSWGTRALAWLIDTLPVAILIGIGWAILMLTQETVCITDTSGYNLGDFCATGASTIGQLSIGVFYVLGLAFAIWNYGYKQGTTGSSIGKGIMKFKVVSEATGQPIGFGMSIVRQIAHFIDGAICYIGYLFPLWDAKRQTIADKIIKTVCLPL